MANKYPLQAGDRTPDLSDRSFAPQEADRRPQEAYDAYSNPQREHGHNMAGDPSNPREGRIYKVGYAEPNSFLSAPFPVIMMDGDNTGYVADVREIDIDAYGDCYDSSVPMRVRTVAPPENAWFMDTDHDGRKN